jgi:hypothetical protein
MSVLGEYQLVDFRKDYPQYDDMSDSELGDALYSTHYSDIPRREFDLKMGLREGQYGATDEIANTMMFGYGDEAKAGLYAAGNKAQDLVMGQDRPESTYGNQLETERAEQGYYREQNPVTSTIAAGAGGLPMGAPGYAAIAKKAGPYIGSVLSGAGAGALYGSGEGEGLEGKTQGGLIGMGMGALLGAGLPAIGMFASNVAKHIKDINPWKDVPAASIRRVMSAMEADGLTPQQAAQRMTEMAQSGKPGALVDLGENLQSLGTYVSKKPGKGRTFGQGMVKDRQLNQMDRITDDVSTGISPKTDVYTMADDLAASRKAEAAPLYKEAYKKDFMSSDHLDSLLKRPAMKNILKNAQDDVSNAGNDASALGYSFNEAGDVVFHKAPSMEALDQIKKTLTRAVQMGKRNPKPNQYSLQNLERDFRKELIKLNPAYGKALSAYSGKSQSMDMLDEGMKYDKLAPEQLTKKINGLSPNDKEFYRMGVARKVLDVARSRTHGANKALAIFGSPKKEAALRPLFKSVDEFNAFKNSMEMENQMHSTYSRVTGGSPTVQLQEEGQALGDNAMNFGRSAGRGDVIGMLGSLAKGGVERLKGTNQATGDEIAKMIFQHDPQGLRAYINALNKQGLKQQTLKDMPYKSGLFSQGGTAIGGQYANKY